MIGKTVAHYRIHEKLGEGGMGVVYKARDEHLDRSVALKLLPPERLADPGRRLRFVQEAKSASALNHPNIVHIYDVIESEGTLFLAMEYVPGRTLGQVIGRKGIPLNAALKHATQIADGLAKAHSAGIVHRDLKPSNVMVTDDGLVKILDFGLAKLTEPGSGDLAETRSALHFNAPRTEEGVVVGTAAYMSPEQAEGKRVDARSDIFSFGALLYEMLSGSRAFHGESYNTTVVQVLRQEPAPLREIVEGVPPELERLIARCLRKDPERRLRSMADLKVALQELKEESDSGQLVQATPAARPAGLSRRKWWVAAAAVGVFGFVSLLLFFLMVFSYPSRQPRVLGYTQITELGAATSYSRDAPLVTDGPRLYFSELVADHLVLAQLSTESGEAVPLATPFRNANLLDIDSTGSMLLVASSSALETEQPLWAVPVPAGPPRRLGDLLGHDGSWSPDREKLVYANGPDLYLARGDGTQSRRLVTVSGTPRRPRWSPNGSVLRFTVIDTHTNSSSLWQVGGDSAQLHPFLPGWNEPPAECCGTWTADGKYFVFQSSHQGKPEVWAILEKRGILGKRNDRPVQLTAGPINMRSPVPSKDGKRLFVIGALPRGELSRYDFKSGQIAPYLSGISAEHLAFSKSGEEVSYITYPGAYLWRSKTDGSERLQLTFPLMQAASPSWSPDGKRIAFFGRTPGRPWKIYLVSAEGGSSKQLTAGERNEADPTWSPDGSVIAFDDLQAPFAVHLFELRTGKISKLVGSDGLWSPLWSPDGRFIAAKRHGSEEQLIFDVAAQKWEELAHMTAGYLNWSLHGNYLYFDTWLGKDPTLYKVRMSDRHIERVVSFNDLPHRTWGSWGPWTGLAPDDSLLFLREVGSQGVYALNWDLP